MGGSSSPQVTQTSQNSTTNPWAPAIPALQDIIGQAGALNASGVGGQTYQGQRIAGFGGDTQGALNSLRDYYAQGPSQAVQNATGYATNLLGSGGLSPTVQDAITRLYGVQGADLSGLTQFLQNYGGNNNISQTANQFMSGRRDINTQGALS